MFLGRFSIYSISAGVALGYTTSGRGFDFEGIENVTGPCLDLMIAKLHPRLGKTGREVLQEAQEYTSGAVGREHCLTAVLREADGDGVAARATTSIKQVVLVFQNMPTIAAGEGEEYTVKRGMERLATVTALMLEVFPEEQQPDGTHIWSVRCTHDRSIVSSEQAAVFVDDTFAHLQRLLSRTDERLSELAVLIPGQYDDGDNKDLVPIVPVSVTRSNSSPGEPVC